MLGEISSEKEKSGGDWQRLPGEVVDEYIILKSNYLALGKELDQEVRWRLLWFSPLHNTVI